MFSPQLAWVALVAVLALGASRPFAIGTRPSVAAGRSAVGRRVAVAFDSATTVDEAVTGRQTFERRRHRRTVSTLL